MKLSAFFLLLTVVGAYSSPGLQNPARSGSGNSAVDPPQTQPTDSEGATLSPRQAAEIRGDVLNARKEYLAAAQAYEDILKNDPRNAQLLNKIGVAYQALGDSDDAERYYKKALRADRNFSTALNNLGTVEYAAGRNATAIKYYRKALGRDPRRASIYSNLGYAYTANHAYAKALEAFGKALAIDPTLYSHHGGAGALLEERSSEDSGTLFFLLAKSYARIGDAEHTVQYLKLAGDGGYTKFAAAAKDADFAPVIENPRVREALHLPALARPEGGGGKTPS